MNSKITIAIDGPAASGKSTVGEQVANRLGFLFFDTGIMYRAVTLAVLQRGIDPKLEDAVSQLAQTVQIDILPPRIFDGRKADVLLDGKDVTWDVRSREVEANVSVVSSYKGVRDAMTEQQRRIGMRGNVVMVGRDIGTVVFPNADLKIYLEASAEERARRRYQELLHRGVSAEYEQILASTRQRDEIDKNRTIAPLRPADDATILMTDDVPVEEVVETIMTLIRENGLVKNRG
ncbi:(d)CMP kinase [Leptolinea tardivitalis]|uniref:Cytidylate kinase n=1 Tax=Leptolinea tardivitalis TaxID=229920 RepID=A0A0P6WSI4_9CHLR|nr:(d)CMP kinase [Leptolinea tardivitalis]KPL71932.1 cytidylate kinase [Leptolinea tardivitalis]GAP20347.1 cytidylate kinase [Leptolinea tardivitalis]